MCDCSFSLWTDIYGCDFGFKSGEIGKFSCATDTKSSAAYKTYVEKTCYSRYEQTYNSPLPLYGFVLFSIGFPVLVSVVYSLVVSNRVEEIETASNGSDEPRTDSVETCHGFHVFYFYFIHLVVRSLFGILFSVLQYTVFYPRGFDFEFSCTLPTSDVSSKTGNNTSTGKFDSTLIACENSTASEKQLWSVIISALNTVFALITLGEVVYLIWRRFTILSCRSEAVWSCDSEFVIVYLLRKRHVRAQLQLTSMDNNSPLLCCTPDSNITDSNTGENTTADSSLKESTDYYKQQILNLSRTHEICYGLNTGLDELYIDVIIHTGRAQYVFSKEMKRHEIFHVYMKVPESSIRLEEIKDLFYPSQDTKGKFPRTILAVGRPGIGKTVLTEKIKRDWANEIDEFYRDKIVFLYKFRWFNTIDEFQNLSLKKFLRYGTGLSEQKFESVFEEILNEPQKAIFIFDGLDEFTRDLETCLEQSQILPNDHNTDMSPMTLFIKLAYGNMLQGATVLVTSRPTANEFYSKLSFDRSIEIIGFTRAKIEEYVSRFCDNIDRDDLKPKIWNHIQSSSDLLNLCYIPVNCFIVCVTLSGCLNDPRNATGALPTTLTKLYQTATNHFASHHNRNLDETSSEQTLEKLQELAFHGIERGQLVFNKKSFNELMKRSGLVNSLSNPVFPIQTQFCFIHLTIQEFLAARHVTETRTADEIEGFISTHIKDSKWYLVLQFLAGLLGEKMKMSDSDYQHCIFAFVTCLASHDGEIELDSYDSVFVMKCLREVDHEDIVKNACKETDLNLVTRIKHINNSLSLSESEAVIYVCKHLHNVVHVAMELSKYFSNDALPKIVKLLQQRCLRTLKFINNGCSYRTNELMNIKCTLNHEHVELNHLQLKNNIVDEDVPGICAFIKNGHGNHLQELILRDNKITSCGISKLCKVLNDVPCRELTHLNLSGNPIGDEGVRVLCYALIQGHSMLQRLSLDTCSLTADCMRFLCEILCDEHCALSELTVADNVIGDEGVRMLCTDALGREQCTLISLNLCSCSLTANCIPPLCELLQDEHCKLSELSLERNYIGDEGVRMLCHALIQDHCKLRSLVLNYCSLTSGCMHYLCEVLFGEHCKLSTLSLEHNVIGDEGVRILFTDALLREQCTLISLNLRKCSLRANCIPPLCELLQNEHCKLSKLSLGKNDIGDEGVRMLCTDALKREQCKLTELKLDYCWLTNQCVPLLCETLEDRNCKLDKLWLDFNDFTENGLDLLRDCGERRGLTISVHQDVHFYTCV